MVTANYCLIQDASGATIDDSLYPGSTITGVDPVFGPLADNGGPTQTMALLPGSPAIDAGSNALIPRGVTTDQRGPGIARIFNGTVDIGAYEVQPACHHNRSLPVTIRPARSTARRSPSRQP